MTVQCCKCKRVRIEGRWAADMGQQHAKVTHTYCPVCFKVARNELQAELRLMRAAQAV